MASDTGEVHLICLAKQPVPGRAKTRLSPEFTPAAAARLAAAALADTLDVLSRTPAAARTLVFDGDPDGWAADGITVVPQVGGGLDERLAAAFEAAWKRRSAPMLLVGMDTPQITPTLLAAATDLLTSGSHDAVLGPASDGGWWALGLTRPSRDVLLGVPMSTPHTGACQRRRLLECGLRVGELPRLDDVDTPADVARVARLAPATSFARVAGRLAVST